MAAGQGAEVEAALAGALAAAEPPAQARLGAALQLWRDNPQAFDTVKSVLSGVEHDGAEGDPADWARTFDRLAAAAPEGGVALYALGNPDLLRAATADVVDRLADWDLLGPPVRALEIGCGIGRFLEALSPRLGQVTGLDISPGMVARARERCAGLPNVAVDVTSGRDLAAVPEASLDLVLAADVFPYLVASGDGLPARMVAEAGRVLRPGGTLAVLNWSYRGDPAGDRAEVEEAAGRAGLAVIRAAEGDFALWDAATFLLRRA